MGSPRGALALVMCVLGICVGCTGGMGCAGLVGSSADSRPPVSGPARSEFALRGAPASGSKGVTSADSVTLSVVTTNDVHGRIWQLPLLGGYLDSLRAKRAADGGAVLLLDAGDVFQGTIESNATEGAAMVRAYSALGYDAVALGNHEFDFGPVGPHAVPIDADEDPLGALKQRVVQADFPFLSANLRTSDGADLRVPGLRAATLLRPAGVPVGIIGGVTEDVLRTTHAANTQGIVVVPLASAIEKQASRLRQQGARVVIALVHAGGECRDFRAPDDLSSCDGDAEVFRLARALSPGSVDVIVAGHTHAGLAHRVHGIAIVEAFANGRAFGRVDITLDRSGRDPPSVTLHPPTELCADKLEEPCCAQDVSYEGQQVGRAQRVLEAIAADMARASEARERAVGVTVATRLWREYRTESPLNNLVADLMLRASSGADAAFTNAGAIRIPLPQGPLRYGTVFEMFPFDNTFATLRISAEQLAVIVGKNLAAHNGILGLSGVRAEAGCSAGELRVRLYTQAGEPIEPSRRLTVVTSDFLASSGDGLLSGAAIGADAITIARDRPIRDALIEGLQAYPGGVLRAEDPSLFDREHPRLRYPGDRPVRCD